MSMLLFLIRLWVSNQRTVRVEYFCNLIKSVNFNKAACGFMLQLSPQIRCFSCGFVLQYLHRLWL